MKNCSCNGSSFRKLISIYVGLSPVYSIFFDMVHHYFACLFMFFTICQSVDVFFFGHWNLIPLGHENLSGIDRLSRVALRVTCGFPQLLTQVEPSSWASCLSPYMFLYHNPRTKFSRRRMNKCRETMMNGRRPSFEASTVLFLLIIKLHFETAGARNL